MNAYFRSLVAKADEFYAAGNKAACIDAINKINDYLDENTALVSRGFADAGRDGLEDA